MRDASCACLRVSHESYAEKHVSIEATPRLLSQWTLKSKRRWSIFHIAGLAFLLSASFSAPLAGQESVLHRLPKQDAIYLWTNDAQTLLKHMKRSLSPDEAIVEELRMLAQRQERAGRSGASESIEAHELIEQFDGMAAFWTMLQDAKLLTGQAVIILPVEVPSDANPRAKSSPRPGIASWSIMAETSYSHDELLELLFKAYREAESDSDAATSGKDSLHRALEDIGVWKVEDGWFCWTSNEVQTDEFLDYLLRRRNPTKTLADDRNFKSAFANLPAPFKHQASFSVYVTEDALPWIAMPLVDEAVILSGIRMQDWRILMLDELRGLGVRVYLSDDAWMPDLPAAFAIDAFLLMTQPRRGPFGALGNPDQPGLDFEMPVPALRLDSFLQFSIDGEKLFRGLIDVQKRVVASDPDLEEVEVDEAAPELQLAKLFVRLCEGKFKLDESDESIRSVGTVATMMFQTSDADALVDQLSLIDDDSQDLIDPSELDSPIREIDDGTIRAWGRSQSSIDRSKEYYRSSIASLQTEIALLQQSSDENDRQRGEALEQAIKSQESIIERLDEQRTKPQMLMFDSWLFIDDFDDDDVQQALADGYHRPHPQLMELEEDAKTLAESFGNRRPPIAVASLWADRLMTRVQPTRRSARAVPGNPNAQPVQEAVDSERETDLVADLVRRQIDKLFFVASADDDGFRIQGALLRPKDDVQDQARQ